jgi:DNA-binding transcriptional ArsR family regulator
MLREAGLLDAERPGAQTRYRASEQRVRAALARASEELLVEGD